MPDALTLGGVSDLVLGQTTVTTVATALMIWLGLLAQPTRATLYWTLGFILALLGSYGSFASAALGADVILQPVWIALMAGMPLLLWSGLRAHAGKRAYPWAGFVQAGLSVLILALTGDPLVFRWVVFAGAVAAAVCASEVVRGSFAGSRFGTPLVIASAAVVLLGIVGVAVGPSAIAAGDDGLLFTRGVVTFVTVYIVCATVSLLFLANRRPGASDILGAFDGFGPPKMQAAIVRERLRRAVDRDEQNWTFVGIRLDDAADLRAATGDLGFTRIVDRFERIIVETFPADADLCRDAPGQVSVFFSSSPATVRELVRVAINRVADASADAPMELRVSASAGIVDVDPASDTYLTLTDAAARAIARAQRDGGDRWARVDSSRA